MKQINIFHISPFPYNSGGIDTWLHQFISRFDKDVKIILICPMNKNFQNKTPLFDISTFTNLEIIYIYERNHNFLYSIFLRPFIYYKQLKDNQNISKASLNLVLSTYPAGFTVKFLKMMDIVNGKFAMSVRGCVYRDMIDLNQSYIVKKIFQMLEKYSMKNFDTLISNGEDTKNYLQKNFNYKSIVIPNAINIDDNETENYRLPEIEKLKAKYKIISHIGTLRKIKNIDKIIKAFYILQKDNDENMILILAGKGSIERYKLTTDKLGIPVIFLGELCAQDVNRLLELSDVVINISYGCGVSNSLLESLKFHSKVVSFDRDTFNQVISHNYNGYLAKDQDCNDLAKKIALALEEDESIIKHIKYSIMQYDWDIVSKKWEKLINEN